MKSGLKIIGNFHENPLAYYFLSTWFIYSPNFCEFVMMTEYDHDFSISKRFRSLGFLL